MSARPRRTRKEERSAEIFDAKTGTSARAFSPGPTLKSARHKINHSVVVLPSGVVIVAGGRAEYATASLLHDGNVLVLGGYDVGMQPVASARLLAAD